MSNFYKLKELQLMLRLMNKKQYPHEYLTTLKEYIRFYKQGQIISNEKIEEITKKINNLKNNFSEENNDD